ncbi:hypothetical protein JIN84_11685 [Luteolibacter yonseiensis]|uniref:Uncharacterized protein n=1 Tax=Luteolibacter yonseiensis TaxID=1144680 RepID=A0A934VBT6_9BACT|nr:hypothetical protein [Luteolibacter yonseiensis]MBK1816276.1 hypothetical protein [Luteolibacter yonseiensis]
MNDALPAKWLSYITVAAIGGTAGWIARPKHGGPQQIVSKEIAPVKPARPGGEDLLDAFVQKHKSPSSPAKGSITDRFNEISKTLPVSADPAADFQKLLAEYSPAMGAAQGVDQLATLGALFSQWIDHDPQAAFTFVGRGYAYGGNSRMVANVFFNDFAGKYLEKHGLPALMDAISGAGKLVDLLTPVISKDLAKRGSMQELKQLRETSPVFFESGQAGGELGKEWPVERRDELLAALDPKSSAAAMAAIAARMEGSSGGEWIMTKWENGELSQEIREAMASGVFGSSDSIIPGITLHQRLGLMRELGTLEKEAKKQQVWENYYSWTAPGTVKKKDEEWIADGMIRNSLRNCFNADGGDDDSLFGFRHGVLDVGEVLKLAKANTVDPGDYRSAYDSQLFRTLAEENPHAALGMLTGMPPKEQEKQKADAARAWSNNINPDAFFRLTESVDTTGDDGLQASLQDAWDRKSHARIHAYGTSYLEWIKTLPTGANKTRALKSIAQGGFSQLSVEAGKLLNQP